MMTNERFGLIVIGNEVLDGRRVDAHFAAIGAILSENNLELGWFLVLPDETDVMTQQLRWAFGRTEPFFCCGGIGGTPDDLTRDSVAAALGIPLACHAEGLHMLQQRFPDGVSDARRLMVTFPEGCDLIPNPVNNVPGFSIRNGYFLPGFPSMAHPMVRWVLDAYFCMGGDKAQAAIVLPNAREADLVYIMERFILDHPELGFSSLPRFARSGPLVELGIKGKPEDVNCGLAELKRRLDNEHVTWRNPSTKESSPPGTQPD